jgi:5-methylcytosine-specific restriction endonuclease McrA
MSFTHLKTFNLEEILPRLKSHKQDSNGETTMIVEVEDETYRVLIGGTKLRLFKRSRKCVSCGIEGNLFILDRQDGHKKVHICNKIHSNVHLNLYCHHPEEGQNYIMMTQDHIIPRCYGGCRWENNLQTMCVHCNHEKKNTFTTDDVKKLASTKDGRRILKESRIRTQKKGLKPLVITPDPEFPEKNKTGI